MAIEPEDAPGSKPFPAIVLRERHRREIGRDAIGLTRRGKGSKCLVLVWTQDAKVPSDSSLVGQTVYVQALIVNNAKPFGDSRLTGYTADLIIK